MQHRSRETRRRGGIEKEARAAKRAAQPGGLIFIIAVTLLLLAGAIITNLPALEHAAWPQYVYPALICIISIAILVSDARWRRQQEQSAGARTPGASTRPSAPRFSGAYPQRTILVSLVVVLVFAVASHYRFGRFHGDGRFLHYHEFYHYYLGSKYFPELGHDGLYAATHRALIENDPSVAGSIALVKNLRTNQLENQAISTERAKSVSRLFFEERWQQFKHDVLFFQSKIPAMEWQFVLVDHGYNASPFWTFLGSLFSAHCKLGDGTLYLLAALDLALICAMFFLVWYAFGLKTALLFGIFFCANFFATFDFTGGAFLRQLWLAGLVGFVCFYQKGRTIPAALCLAVSALDRAFPLVFLLLPAVLLVRDIWRRRSLRQGQLPLLAATVFFLVLLGGLSTTTTGISAWKNWYDTIRAHDQWFSNNAISLRSLFTINPMTASSLIDSAGDESLWRQERESLNAQSQYTLRAVRAVLLVLLIILIARAKEPGLSLGLLSFAPFLLFYPANYYEIVLIVVMLCWESCRGLAIAMLVVQIVSWLLCTVFAIPMQIEVVHWLVCACLLLTFGAFLVVGLVRNARGQRGFAVLCLAVVVVGALFVGGAVAADRRAGGADRAWPVLDLTPDDVRSVTGATPRLEQMTNWGNGWSRNDHLAFAAQGPGAQATVDVPARQAGLYRVKIDYTAAPFFGMLSLRVNDQGPFGPVNLFSPRTGILPVVYDAIRLTEGRNDFRFTVEGKDPASTDYRFAIDRIVLTRMDRPGGVADAAGQRAERRAALDKAVSWLLDHPADAFDGGRNGVCAEIVTFYYLLTHLQLGDNRTVCRSAIQERLARLNAGAGNRIEPDEYEMLATAAYIARQLKIEFPAFDVVAERARRQALSVRADGSGLRPLSLCTYLNRLDRGQEVPCGIEQSALYREHSERRVATVLSGPVDRTKAAAVRLGLFSIAGDVCVLTDFGRQRPAQAAVLDDRGFWAELCEGGIRWGMETGDFLLVARLVLVAKCLCVESAVPSFEAAVDYLTQHQEADGSFGPANPYSPNPLREGVLAGVMAIASGL